MLAINVLNLANTILSIWQTISIWEKPNLQAVCHFVFFVLPLTL